MTKANKFLEKLPKKGNADNPIKLDPNFFTPRNRLKPEIRKVLINVLADVRKELKDKGFELEDEGVILTGSLVSVNYDKDSDVDFHVLVDFSKADDPKLTQNFLQSFARNYNKRFNLRGRNLELYFQDSKEPHVSPGVYDVINNDWVIAPDGMKINRTPQMILAAENIKQRVEQFVKDYEEADNTDKAVVTAHLNKLQGFFQSLRNMRKEGLNSDGLASFGNQVFKLLRRNGTFDMLTKLITQVKDDFFECKLNKSDILLQMCEDVAGAAAGLVDMRGMIIEPNPFPLGSATTALDFDVADTALQKAKKKAKDKKKRDKQVKDLPALGFEPQR